MKCKSKFQHIIRQERSKKVIFADFTIGIDIEYLDGNINYLDFQRQMTQSEFEKIHNSPNKIRSFFKYWTEKEAVIKACGKGLSVPLDSFEISQKNVS